jgi:hypothetical protein
MKAFYRYARPLHRNAIRSTCIIPPITSMQTKPYAASVLLCCLQLVDGQSSSGRDLDSGCTAQLRGQGGLRFFIDQPFRQAPCRVDPRGLCPYVSRGCPPLHKCLISVSGALLPLMQLLSDGPRFHSCGASARQLSPLSSYPHIRGTCPYGLCPLSQPLIGTP